eukprot:TRINITY_DN5575_c0_g1_i8.p1 TRINITY_DN5575_c0_g1~~TRINITY_DN5575_c0_g1_i8.p1  ORF type:complete len:613 (-),score=154.95 TRINITY_DN5575_c0_g1_i8:108-1946(-)
MATPESSEQQDQQMQEEEEEQVEYENEKSQSQEANVSKEEEEVVEQVGEEHTLNGHQEKESKEEDVVQNKDGEEEEQEQEYNREDRVEHEEDRDLDEDDEVHEPSTKRQRVNDREDRSEDLDDEEKDKDDRSQKDDEEEEEDCSHIEIGTDDPMKMPPHGTEIFMGGIPHDATDEEITGFCKGVGRVFKTHIPRDPKLTQQNKGYAFIMFFTRKEARQAIATLNSREFPNHPEKKVRVSWSQQRNKLFLGNIPKHYTQEMILSEVQPECRGINEVELVASKEVPGENRGFCFIEYYNSEAANQARISLGAPTFKMGGRQITVTWAEPKKVDSESDRVRSVYVGNLPETINEDMLREVFAKYGEIEKVVLPSCKEEPGRLRDYGFVHFTERTSAVKAVDSQGTDKPTADGKELKVAMARLPSNQDQTGSSFGAGMMNNFGRGGMRGGMRGMMGRRGEGMSYGLGNIGDLYYDGGDFGQQDGSGGGAGGMYDQYVDYSAYYGQAGGSVMVPMMLPNGQVGYMISGGATTPVVNQQNTDNRVGQRGGDGRFSQGGYGGYRGYEGGGGGNNYDDDYNRGSRRSGPPRSGSGGYQSRNQQSQSRSGGSGGGSRYRPY